jgi:hypothetical protein
MRLISKKTPFLIAGAEVLRRKLKGRRTIIQKKSALPRILGLSVVAGGAVAGVKYFSNPRRRWQAREQISTLKEKVKSNGRNGDTVVNVSEEFAKTQDSPTTRS